MSSLCDNFCYSFDHFNQRDNIALMMDFSINESGEPVMIELNIGSGVWGQQSSNGMPLFGDFTSEIKEYIDSKKNRFLP